MKRAAIILFVLLYCISLFSSFTNAAVSRSRPNPLRKPGGCYEEKTGHLTAGQKITVPGRCTSATCASDGTIVYHSCGTVSTPDPKCHITEKDLSKPHPDCCHRIVCDEE